jgi:hypothetical protein
MHSQYTQLLLTTKHSNAIAFIKLHDCIQADFSRYIQVIYTKGVLHPCCSAILSYKKSAVVFNSVARWARNDDQIRTELATFLWTRPIVCSGPGKSSTRFLIVIPRYKSISQPINHTTNAHMASQHNSWRHWNNFIVKAMFASLAIVLHLITLSS